MRKGHCGGGGGRIVKTGMMAVASERVENMFPELGKE